MSIRLRSSPSEPDVRRLPPAVAEYVRNVRDWAREVEQAIRSLDTAIAAIPTGGGGSSAAVWGAITGTLTDQTDLATALGKNRRAIVLCAGFTPATTGADITEVPVPFDEDGTTALTYTVVRLTLRVQTAGGAPAVKVQKSSATGGFTPTDIGTVTLSSGASEGSITSFSSSTVTSGNKLRLDFVTLATAENWTVVIELAH